MNMWNDYITREDLETETGEIDQEKVRALGINLYLAYIEGCVELGGCEFPDIAAEKVGDIMFDEYSIRIHATEGRWPDPEEIEAYLNRPESIEARKTWTEILTKANEKTWPGILKVFREELKVPEDIPLKNEEQINEKLEKQMKERTWDIREL